MTISTDHGHSCRPSMHHGIDLVHLPRFHASLEGHEGIVQRLFTDHERDYCESRPKALSHFAARFAAKEATMKMLGMGLTAVGLSRDLLAIEVRREGGAPSIRLTGRPAKRAAKLGITDTALSMSHDGDHAIASIIGWSSGPSSHETCARDAARSQA